MDEFLIEYCGDERCTHGEACGLVAGCPGCGCCCIEHPCECDAAEQEGRNDYAN